VDVPGSRPIIDALAGEGGHAPLKRSRRGPANCQSIGDRSAADLLAVVDVENSPAFKPHTTATRLKDKSRVAIRLLVGTESGG
jgi:hypothetical protein